MAKPGNEKAKFLRKMSWKILKATLKAAIFYVIYLFLWSFLSPITGYVNGLQLMVETFATVYLILMIIGELTGGTIYEHFFHAAKALFVIAYLLLSLQGGVWGMTYENVSLMIDLRLFLSFAVLLGLLGFAKSLLQAINFMHEKSEPANI